MSRSDPIGGLVLRRPALLSVLALPLAAGAAVTLGRPGQLAAVALALGFVALAAPGTREVLTRGDLLPLLLCAPSVISVYPALAVPVTSLVLVGLLVTARARESLALRDLLAALLVTSGLLLPLVPALVSGAAPVYVLGDAVQFVAFYLAVAVARSTRLDLLARPCLWGLCVAAAAVSLANHLGRVDYLAATGSDIQRNINFLAPVLLLWGLADLLWNGLSFRTGGWVATGGVLVLAGFTRGMWAGAAAGVLVVGAFYLVGRRLRLPRVRRLVAVVLLIAAALLPMAVVAPDFTRIAQDKVSSIFERQTDYTYQQRVVESAAVLDQLDDRLWGEGWGATYVMPTVGLLSQGETHYVHNQYVAQLARTGWVGCAVAAASLLLLLRLRPGLPGSALAAGTLAYVLVTGWTSPSLFTYPTNLLAGLAVGAAPFVDARWQAARGGAALRRR